MDCRPQKLPGQMYGLSSLVNTFARCQDAPDDGIDDKSREEGCLFSPRVLFCFVLIPLFLFISE